MRSHSEPATEPTREQRSADREALDVVAAMLQGARLTFDHTWRPYRGAAVRWTLHRPGTLAGEFVRPAVVRRLRDAGIIRRGDVDGVAALNIQHNESEPAFT